jgi:hypothetical protein
MGIEGFEDLCTNRDGLKVAKCKGLSNNPVAFRCEYCQKQYDLVNAKAKSGAVKYKPFVEARRQSVSQMSAAPGITAARLHNEWTSRVDEIYVSLYARALRRTFPPVFALCLCGSLARREACPYSDIDSFLLVEELNDEDIEYLRRVGMEVRNCLWGMGGDANGFQLCRGGLHPINIIETPASLVDQLAAVEQTDPGSHLLGIRDSPRFLFGKRSLFKEFEAQVLATKNRDFAGSKAAALTNLRNLVARSFQVPRLTEPALNIKEQLYRPVQLLLKDLSAYFGIRATDGRTQVLQLTEFGAMSPTVANYLINLLEDVGRLRTQNHLRAKKENDFLILSQSAAQPGDVVANNDDKGRVKACLERLAVLKQMTERFVNDYAVARSRLARVFSKKPKNPFTVNHVP